MRTFLSAANGAGCWTSVIGPPKNTWYLSLSSTKILWTQIIPTRLALPNRMPPKTNSTSGESIPEEISSAIASASPQGPGAPPPPLTPSTFFAYAIGTVAGLGYVKPGPGTWGSFVGLVLYGFITEPKYPHEWPGTSAHTTWWSSSLAPAKAVILALAVTVVISILGVWAAGGIEKNSFKKDPQFVIIDEVSGQMLALSAGFAPLNWKYLLLGFILFRVFDITKPFPARQAEKLPGGWGIMADDWAAALFAAALLWVARGFGM